LHYDFIRPTYHNLTFTSNKAQYGNNIASYPVKIRLKDSDEDTIIFNSVGSGIALANTVELIIVDYDNQIMNLDNINKITIKSMNISTSQVLGTTSVVLK
jgi:hypothetical protein